MSRVFLTGYAGFAGSALFAALEDEGHDVIGFDQRLGDDIRDYEQVRCQLLAAEPDLIFHLAAVASPSEAARDPRRAMDVNLGGTANLLEAVRVTGIGARILVAGTSDEYGYTGRSPGEVLTEESACHPDGVYGASKLAATALAMAYARAYGLRVVVTRAWMHNGPGGRAASVVSTFARRVVAVERGEADSIEHGDLTALVDLTDVRDVVRAYRMAIGCEPGVYNVCRGELVPLADVLDGLLRQTSLTKVELKPNANLGYNRGTVIPNASAAKLHGACGWKPEIGLDVMLKDLLDYWRGR